MNQTIAMVWLSVLLGVLVTHWLRRLAPLLSELPGKALLSTLLLAAVAISGSAVSAFTMVWLALPVTAWLVVPLLLPSLARAGGWSLALALVNALYWTPRGRDGLRRLVAQTALVQGDGARALAALPRADGEAFAAQAQALLGDWSAVLAIELPAGAHAPAGKVARVEALLAQGRRGEAVAVAQALRVELERGGVQPLLYRAVVLAEAHIDAAEGNVRRLGETLENPPAGVPVAVWFGLLARAAEQAGERERALRLHAEAYRVASPLRRAAHAAVLDAAGRARPAPLRAVGRTPATGVLVALIGLAYAGQWWLDRSLGSFTIAGFSVDPSAIAAALLLGFPDVPASTAPWRTLSYAFVHGNVLHVGLNLWVLWDLGRMVEVRRGRGYLLAAFALGTWLGGWLTATVQAGEALVLVGASAGVLGVAGAWLADLSRRRSASDRAQLRSLVQWLVLMAFISLALPFVSWWGHLGGVLGGMLWGFVRLGLPSDRRFDLIAGVAAALALAWAAGQALRVAWLLL